MCQLPIRLQQELDAAEFAEVGGFVTFAGNSVPTRDARKDLTGLECLLNKWQMDEYVSEATSLEEITLLGICFALALQNKLAGSRVSGELRLVVSCSRALNDSLLNTCTIHLHKLRLENPWLNSDIESYSDQGVLTMDWLNSPAPSFTG